MADAILITTATATTGATSDTDAAAPFFRLTDSGWKFGDCACLVYDIEIHPNQFTVAFFNGGEIWRRFSLNNEVNEMRALADFVSDRTLVLAGFNSFEYDDAMLGVILRHADHVRLADLKAASDLLISARDTRTDEEKKSRNKLIYAERPWHASIDLFQLLNRKGSLKEFECRMGLAQVADCPIPFDQDVSPAQRHLVEEYNGNDITATHELMKRNIGLVELRHELVTRYHLDRRIFAESEPQIAERYLVHRYWERTGKTKMELKSLTDVSSHNLATSFPVHDLLPVVQDDNTGECRDLIAALAAGTIQREGNKFVLVTGLPLNQARIGGLSLTFGCGGLHSNDEPGSFRADDTHDLVDVDVTSYYPALMIELGIKPAHLLSTFTDLVRELRDQRVAAKRAGQAVLANALKIVINSLFGKLGDRYSCLRDDRACLQVTITGQAYLLQLIAAVQAAGATVLSANTDGLLLHVPRTSRAAVTAARQAWEQKTRMSLEATPYTAVIRRDVNAYVAISTKVDAEGRPMVKAKGAFNPDATKTSGSIVPLAVIEHLRTGADLAMIVNRHERAVDFCHYARAQSDGHFEQGGTLLPRTVRWYTTVTSGDPAIDDQRTIKRVSAAGNRAAIPDGANATLALTLTTTKADELPGLDREPYLRTAQALLDSALASPEVETSTRVARGLQASGLILMPLDGHKSPAGVALDDIGAILNLQSRSSRCWAVVTGEVTETLTLDLDLPETIDPALREILARHPTLTTWHGNGRAADVRACGKRGAVHYRYAGGDIRIRTRSEKKWTQSHGFEVAYGKKLQTVIGPHRSAGDEYALEGDVVEAPPELIEYLGLRLKNPKTRAQSDSTSPTVNTDDQERLAAAADAVLGTGWGSPFVQGNWVGVRGVTPGHLSDLRLYLRGHCVNAHTFHASYDSRGTAALVQAEYDQRRPDPDPNGSTDAPTNTQPDPALHLDPSDRPQALDVHARLTAASCYEAFQQDGKAIVIIGPTGSGKSHACARVALERHSLNEKTLIVTQDKEGIEQMRRQLLDQAAAAGMDLAKLKLQVAVSMRGAEADDDHDGSGTQQGTATGEIRKDTLIVVTHHHFASRKRLTRELYAPLHWATDQHALVIIDEADLFIERQNLTETLSNRYKFIGGRHGSWYRLTHCPSSGGSFSCKTCVGRPGGRIENRGTHLTYQAPGRMTTEAFNATSADEFSLGDEHLPVTSTVDLPTMHLRLKALEQTTGYLPVRSFEKPAAGKPTGAAAPAAITPQGEFLAYLRDAIDCAWLPTLAEVLPVDGTGTFIEQDPHIGAVDALGPDGGPSVSTTTTITWQWPYWLCHSRYLLLYDRAPLYYLLQRAAKVVLMSATIGKMHIDFIHACASRQRMVTVELPAPTFQPLERIHLIAHQARIDWVKTMSDTAARVLGCQVDSSGISNRTTIERLGNALAAAGHRPLVFLGTKEIATTVFDAMKERGWSLFIEGEYRSHAGKAVAETDTLDGSMSLLSYARSSLGTGANLPAFDVVIVDGTVVRPHFLFNPSEKTEDALLTMQEDDRLRILTQNVGRILRGSGVKTIFAVGLSPDQSQRLAAGIGALAGGAIEVWHTPEDTIAAFATLTGTVRKGVLTPAVPTPPAAGKAANQLSTKQRAQAQPTPADKAALRLQKALVQVAAGAAAGNSWRATAKKLHAERYSDDEVSQMRKAFTAAGGNLAEDAG